MNQKQLILGKLAKAVSEFDSDASKLATEEALSVGIDPVEVVEKGLNPALEEIGRAYEEGEIFVVELVMAGVAAKTVMEILEPELLKRKGKSRSEGMFLIGTVAGDIHDLGKNIVATLLTVHGFHVIDLGVDVPTNTFVEKVKELEPDIVGASALMTTTKHRQKELVDALESAGLRKKVKVMIGGAAVDETWSKKIGADAYAEDAMLAVEKAKELIIMKDRSIDR